MEPIAKGVAARGHEVHLVAPWHPAITRGNVEDGVSFHFFHYAPVPSLNVFGYASGLRADTDVRSAAWVVAPLALAAGAFKAWRVAAKKRATVMHGHWVVPGGVMAARAPRARCRSSSACTDRTSIVAERRATVRRAAAARVPTRGARHRLQRRSARRARSRSARMPRARRPCRTAWTATRFAPSSEARAATRRALGLGDAPVVFTAGRLVRKKGFEYLIDAAGRLAPTRRRSAW